MKHFPSISLWISLLLQFSALPALESSTIIIGIGGGPPELQSGAYITLYGFEEEYDYDTQNYSYTTEKHSNQQVSLSADVEEFYAIGDHVYEIQPILLNAPEGMSAEYNGSLTITWQCPYVLEPTNFNFEFGVRLIIDGEVVETLTDTHTVFVKPALPFISYQDLSLKGFRINDPISDTPTFQIWDPDESIEGNELSILNPDPRLIFTQDESDSSNYWQVSWNTHFPAPILTEIIPVQLSLEDFDGSGTRRTPRTLNTTVFGYSYEKERIPAPNPIEDGHFGAAVTIQGDRAYVVAEGSAVSIYEKDSAENWVLAHTLTSPSPERNFGSSLAVEGPFLAVSAVALEGSVTGAVYIYRYYEIFDRWTLTQTLTPDESELEGMFGGEIALTQPNPNKSEYTLMVSADGAESNGEHTGAVWVFEDTTASSLKSNFTKRQVLIPEDAAAYDYFGWPLALEGDIAVLPANEDDEAGWNAGAVYVYRRNHATGIWALQQKLLASDSDSYDLFGERVAISEQGIFISAFRKYKDQTEVGAVYHFKENNGLWQEQGRIHTIEEQPSETWFDYEWSTESTKYTIQNFGSSVAADGNTLLIAARRRGQGWPNRFHRSVVYQFEWQEAEQNWQEVRVLCGSDTDSGDIGDYGKYFGELQMLAMDGSHIIVGDFGSETENVPDSGIAYIFNTTVETPKVPSPYAAFQVSLNNDAPSKSAPEEDADGDRISNLHEFFAGTDPMVPNPPTNWPGIAAATVNENAELIYYFRQSIDRGMLQPTFYASNTLTADSWREISKPRFKADRIEGDQLIRGIDVSDEITDGEALFLRMSLNPTHVSE
ncbi:hypothetical protein ACWPKO_00135 [Coraliomargarita sp. W4R53]